MARKRALIAVVLLALSGCASHTPPRDIALSTEPAGAGTRLIYSANGAVETAARIEPPKVLWLQHAGSTGCPGVVSAVTRENAHAVSVKIWQNYKICNADARVFVSRIQLPDGIETDLPLHVNISYGDAEESVVTVS